MAYSAMSFVAPRFGLRRGGECEREGLAGIQTRAVSGRPRKISEARERSVPATSLHPSNEGTAAARST